MKTDAISRTLDTAAVKYCQISQIQLHYIKPYNNRLSAEGSRDPSLLPMKPFGKPYLHRLRRNDRAAIQIDL